MKKTILQPKIQKILSKKPSKKRSITDIFLRKTLPPNRFKKVVLVLLGISLLFTSVSYGVARWYIANQSSKPLVWATTFIPSYARYFELDPRETLNALIYDLGLRQFRFVSYWSDIEKERGKYNFEDLDWQFKMAEESGSKVSLAIGLRQPRWPECHMPTWAERLPKSQWSIELKNFMQVVIERYRNSPALQSWQLENEYFMKVFGICPDHSRSRLIDEYNFVKSIDQDHPIIVSRSNNWLGIPIQQPIPDQVAISVYKRVWDKTITKRYFEYPLPAWFYASLGGYGKLVTNRDLIIHELQAEPWMPEGDFPINSLYTIAEQNKSMNADRLKHRLEYGRATGLREIYLWGTEWWYWRKEKANDPSIWNVAKEQIRITNEQNQLIKN